MQSKHGRGLQLARNALTALLCASLTVTGIGAAAAQSIELRWKLEPGTELVYRVSVETETELPQGMGTVTMRMETTQRWSVQEVDGDGNAVVRATTGRVRMSMSGPMGTMSVDSADETGSGSPLDGISAMAGTSYSVVMDPRGALVGMSGIDEMLEELRAQIANPAVHATLDQMVSEEALRAQWEQGVGALPAEAVSVGSTWDNTFRWPIPQAGSMTVVTSHEVESIDEGLVVIGVSGTMSLADGAAASSPIPVRFGDATIMGTSRFDAGRGLLLGSEATTAIEMSMAMGGREAGITMASTMTLELVE